MEPKIVTKPAFSVVGLKYRGKSEQNEIPQLWGALMPRVGEIKNITNQGVCYGLGDNFDESSGEFDYVAGFEVSSTEGLPAGMVHWDVPETRYAVFTCSLSTLREIYRYAYFTWLPQSEYERGPGPDVELYDERFDAQNPASEFDILVPIQ